jgi:D-tyrosyl-tRNA(Tyr) deacylase
MRIVLQRVISASVEVEKQIVGSIGKGLLVYLSVGKDDTDADAEYIADKIINLRIFSDEQGKMNRSIQEVGGDILIVSNFTLHGDCRKGRRPGFDAARDPSNAKRLYEKVIKLVTDSGIKVANGIFGAYMQVSSVNDGPVTFLLDSTRMF